MSQRPVEILPGEGKSLQLGGLGVRFKIDGDATGGSFSVVEHPLEPGVLIFPHSHRYEDEHSFVMEGTIGARVGDRVVEAGPGSYVLKPRGVPHTIWNAGPTTARILEIIAPAGFEKYYEQLASIFFAGTPPDMGKVAELIERFGLTTRLDWVGELEATYGVALNRPAIEGEGPD